MAITSCSEPNGTDLGNAEQLLKALVAAQISLGKELFRLLGAGTESAIGGLGALKMPKMKSCCDMPEPCWMPLPLGEATCQLSAEGVGELRFIVTNQDFRAHTVTVKAAGKDAGLVQLTPAQAVLGPKERATFVAKFTAPTQTGDYEALVWILGCRDHYLRWTIQVGSKQKACCYEVTVDDEPDYVVHWYDHFYCKRPCMGSTAAPTP